MSIDIFAVPEPIYAYGNIELCRKAHENTFTKLTVNSKEYSMETLESLRGSDGRVHIDYEIIWYTLGQSHIRFTAMNYVSSEDHHHV